MGFAFLKDGGLLFVYKNEDKTLKWFKFKHPTVFYFSDFRKFERNIDETCKLEQLKYKEVLERYFVGRKKLEEIEDSLAFVKAMNEVDVLRLGSAEEFTKSSRIK